MDSGSMVVITLALVTVFLIFPGAVAVWTLRNDYSGWTIAILGSMLLMLGPVVSIIALIATTRIKSLAVTAADPAQHRSAPPPHPFRSAQWSSQVAKSGTTCGSCGKPIHEPAGGAAEVLLGSLLNFSNGLEYPCKSCGTVFCLDCMSVLRRSGTCPKCGGYLGW